MLQLKSTPVEVLAEARSVVATHHVLVHLAMAVRARHPHRHAVAQVVMRRVKVRRIAVTDSVAVAIARPRRIAVVPGVKVGAVAVGPRAFVAATFIAIMMVVAIAAPAAFPIGRDRREVAGTGKGRTLVDVIILVHALGIRLGIGQPLMGPAAAGVAAAVGIGRRRGDVDLGLRARLDMPGEIKSLNVSNAAVLALYIGASRLGLMG